MPSKDYWQNKVRQIEYNKFNTLTKKNISRDYDNKLDKLITCCGKSMRKWPKAICLYYILSPSKLLVNILET